MSGELTTLSARELSALVHRRVLSPVEIMEAVLARIEECQPRINAFIGIGHDRALEAAREAEREVVSGRLRGPLHGLPYAAKDLIASSGMRTTMGSHLFEGFTPEHDAVAITRLRAGGAILAGKTTTSEFGHKPFTDGPLFGRTLNPFDAGATCGGSSGGSAAALASGQVPLALGTDGGGSIRIPAACCGVAGLKATLGVIPHLDLPDLFSANAYVGPMARSVDDVAFLFEALSGFDRRDPFGQGAPAPDARPFPGTKGLRVGWMERVGNPITDPECITAAERALHRLEEAGAVIEPAAADFSSVASAFLVILQSALRSRLLEPRENEPQRLDPSLVETIDRGAQWTAVDLHHAARERTACFRAVQSLFERHDLLVSPTLAAPPLSVHQDPHGHVTICGVDAGLIRAAWYPYTLPFNLTGHPALSLPCGKSAAGLPLGVQLVAPWHGEDLLLGVGAELESSMETPLRAPPECPPPR